MGKNERREREREQRKNIIVDAAERVFFSKGYVNATMDDVAEAAEIGKGTLYLYFKSKMDLYYALLFRFLEGLKQKLEAFDATNAKGMDKLMEYGKVSYNYFMAYPDDFKTLMYSEAAEISSQGGSTYMAKCFETDNLILDIIVKALREGMEDGTVRKDIEPEKTALVVYKILVGILKITVHKMDKCPAGIPQYHGTSMEEIFFLALKLVRDSLRPTT